MRVLVTTLGTRGDLEIFLALARALARRGHAVRFASSPFHLERVRAAGLEAAALGSGEREALVAILRALAPVTDKERRTRLYAERWLAPQLAAARARLPALAADADYFVSNLKLALRRGGRLLPGAAVTYDPPLALDGFARTGALAHGEALLDLVALPQELVDPERCWPRHLVFTGFWSDAAPAACAPPPALAAFVRDGPPPVVATLGSMAMLEPAPLLAALRGALARAGRRAVVVGGWSAPPAAADPGILWLPEADYDWLFPRALCVLHHGGTGTVAAVLRAGRPSILLPQLACQERFAERLAAAGLVAGCFDAAALAPEPLAAAITRAHADPALAAAARRWQQGVAQERGVEAAVDAIEGHAARAPAAAAPVHEEAARG
jgi:UDP:flavonoid glycosyltransferase YjiC (YdhE family)